MSCNGCRVLRKGCSDKCMLRQCLQCIDTPQAQGHATLFLAKFFGRAGLISFISAVPLNQRPALFQSLLFEAVGRTISPVSGAVGLLWDGNWRLCHSAVETVLRGGTIHALPELTGGVPDTEAIDYGFETGSPTKKSKFEGDARQAADLDLCLTSGRLLERRCYHNKVGEKRRSATPSEESETTTLESASVGDVRSEQSQRPYAQAQAQAQETKLLRLFF